MAKYTLKAPHYGTINTTSVTNHNKFRVKGLNNQSPDQKYHTRARPAKLVIQVSM